MNLKISRLFIAAHPNCNILKYLQTNINIMSTIIGSLTELKTLVVQFLGHPFSNGAVATCQNLNLEEIIVRHVSEAALIEPLYNILTSCSKLKRLRLDYVSFNEHQILGLIQNLRLLTHFWFCFSSLRKLFSYHGGESDKLDPLLKKVITCFRKSPEFVNLGFQSIADFGSDQQIKDLLSVDAGQIIVTKTSKPLYETCDLNLARKSKTRDPNANFNKKRFSFY